MKELKLQDLSARVVAWHNRHPLARRLTEAHVQSVGYVVLPYLGPGPGPGSRRGMGAGMAHAASDPPAGAGSADPHGGATLRERAMARAQGTVGASGTAAVPSAAPEPPTTPSRTTLTPAFSEDFIAPLATELVGRWAAEHGMVLATARADAPVRQVTPSGPLDPTRLQPVWLLTAQLEVGRARSRVLVGAADDGQLAAVLGRRMWSLARIGTLVALPVLLGVALIALVGLRSGAPLPAEKLPPLAPASAAAAAADLAASAPAAVAGTVAGTVAATTANAAEPARPVDVEPTLGRVALPPIGPRADERRRAADQAREQAQPSSAAAPASAPRPPGAAPTGPAAPSPASSASPAPPAPPTPPPVASAGPAFAVSTRMLRTRTEGEQVAAAMRALLVTPGIPGTPPMRVEVMPAGEDWRVVGWPYADRALAEKARALLAARGMKVQVIDF